MTEISEIFRKMALFGIGAIAISQEKIEEFTQEMIKKGEMNREEGKKFVLEVLSEKDRQRKEVEEKINKKVKEVIESSGISNKKDIENLSKRMEKIEDLPNRMEKIEAAFERLKQI